MGERLLAEESPIESPRHWPEERLVADVERVALRIAMAKENAFAGRAADIVTILAAKLSLYSNELARRASDRSAAAADREAASNRRLTKWAIGIAVGSLVIAVVQAVLGYLALPK